MRAQSLICAVVFSTGLNRYTVHVYRPGEVIPGGNVCTASVPIINGKFDRALLKQKLRQSLKKHHIDPKDVNTTSL